MEKPGLTRATIFAGEWELLPMAYPEAADGDMDLASAVPCCSECGTPLQVWEFPGFDGRPVCEQCGAVPMEVRIHHRLVK